LVLNLPSSEQELLKDVADGRYFGITVIRRYGQLGLIRNLQSMGLARQSTEHHAKYGTAQWTLTYCGVQAAKLIRDAEVQPMFRMDLIKAYNQQAANCPDKQRPKPRRNPAYSEEQRLEAVSFCMNTNLSYEEISKIMNVPVDVITVWCLEAAAARKPKFKSSRSVIRRAKTRPASQGAVDRPARAYDPVSAAERTSKKEYPPTKLERALQLCRETKLSYGEIAQRLDIKDPWYRGTEIVRSWCLAAGARKELPEKKSKTSKKDRKKYTDKQYQLVQNLCQGSELTLTEIAKQTGVQLATVSLWCRKGGWREEAKARKSKKLKYSNADQEKVIALCRDTALSYSEIARQTGIDRQTVMHWCLDAGVRQKGILFCRVCSKSVKSSGASPVCEECETKRQIELDTDSEQKQKAKEAEIQSVIDAYLADPTDEHLLAVARVPGAARVLAVVSKRSSQRIYQLIEAAKQRTYYITLYHGTLKARLPEIEKYGLQPTEGWGGAGTVGVFLSKDRAGAKYWAKLAFLLEAGEKLEERIFDRKYQTFKNELVLLKVMIPVANQSQLKADMEQAEDVYYEGNEDDWQRSLEEIGDVRFDGTIPPEWIVNLSELT